MIDPISALEAVQSAVKLIKKASATVDDVRSLGPLLGKYFDAKSVATQAARDGKKAGGSSMGKAIEIELALKAQADFENELQMLFMTSGNIDVWNNIKERAKAMEDQARADASKANILAMRKKREQEELLEVCVIALVSALTVGLIVWGVVEIVDYCRVNICGRS